MPLNQRYHVQVLNPQPKYSRAWQQPAATAALCLAFCAVLLCAACLNLWVNPFGLYWSQRFDPAADSMRVKKFELLRQMKQPASTLIVGSSRVMTMNPTDVERQLPGPCFNFGMPGALAEDYYAAVRLAVEEAKLPLRAVVLGIDFEAFNPATPIMSEARYFPQFRSYLQGESALAPRLSERLALLISMQQTEESLNVLRRGTQERQGNSKLDLLPDGLVFEAERERSKSAGTFSLAEILKQRVRKYASRSLHLESYTRVDPLRLSYLSRLLDYCQEHGVAVYAFVTPYHPELWRVLDGIPQTLVLKEVTAAVASEFSKRGLAWRDFSRLESFGGEPADFYDEIHMWPSNERRLIDALGGRPERK